MNPDPFTAPVVNRFLDTIQRHANYVISTSSYVEDIKRKKNELVATKADLNEKIEGARRKLEQPNNQNQVVLWQEEVDAIIHIIDEVVTKYETRACFCTVCSKYKTGHRCDDKVKEVDKLLEQGSQYLNEEMVVCDKSIFPISLPYLVPGSLESNVAKALYYIQNDNSKVNVIGIWGFGGVGKTTLLKKIHNSCIGNDAMFKTVIWIVASKEQSDITITVQRKIVEKLGLAKRDDVHSQAHVIHSFLIDQNFLLFIDDLWDAVELTEVGVPNLYEVDCGKRRKVIFTTRLQDVCGNMDAKEPIKVNCLNWDHSWLLFKEKVGDADILSDHRISRIAEGIVEECKGLPLALKTIGRAMSQKKHIKEWKSALELIKESQVHNVPGIKKDEMQHILKLSYDYLDDDVLKKCFLTISMWPEGFIISKEKLIECWMGLDIINNFESIYEAHQRGDSLIGRLVAASLLEYDNYTHLYVMMHDIVRDLALWIASGCGKNKWMVKAGIGLQYVSSIEVKWSEAEYISLMHNSIKELPSGIPSCPYLLTLMLQGNQLKCESIVNYSRNFQSLKYLDLSTNGLHSFPESICDLPALQYLNLSRNEIEDIPKKLGNLKELKYLLLQSNRIRCVQRGVLTELVKLLVLNLASSKYNEKYSLVNIEELKWLEKKLLYLGISVWGEEEFNKLLLLPDLRIVSLCIQNLHITSFSFMSIIPNPYCLRNLSIGDCSDGLSEIIFEKNEFRQDLPSINLESLVLEHLHKLERITWKGIEPKKLFAELQRINIYGCSLDDITWIIHLPSLTHLGIYYCDNMRIAIKNEENDDNSYVVEPNISTFPSLKFLRFYNMSNLEKIFTCSLAFPELLMLEVYECPLLKTLPFDIESTPKLSVIDGSKDWWDKLEWEDDDFRSHFSQLLRVRW